MGGFSNLYKLDEESQKLMLKNDLICIFETWQYDESNFKVPIYLQNYSHMYSLAKKEAGSRGRASGGISLFLKKSDDFEYNIKETETSHIIIDIVFKSYSIRIGAFYWRPQVEFDDMYLNSLQNILYEMSLSDQIDLDVICLGDFNARIGNLNNDYDDYIFDDSQLSHVRNTCDTMVKPRGMKLTEIMESMGFVVLNGRSRSDAQGCFTYMSERGNSLIDLTWVNCSCLQNIIDFSLTDLSVFSDHLLCSIQVNKKLPSKLNSNLNSNNQSIIKSLRWNQNKNFEYTQHLSNDFNIYFNSDDANALFENLTTSIKASMNETNMFTTKHPGARKLLNRRGTTENVLMQKKY